METEIEGLVRLSHVEPTAVTWIWKPYIPQGKLTIIEGDPGAKKSWLTLGIASAIANGDKLPNSDSCIHGNVLLFSAEDDPEDTLVPRLVDMGADRSRIFSYGLNLELDPDGIGRMNDILTEVQPKLVVLDPLQCFMATKDMHRANETRMVMAPLGELARIHECAIVGVRHLAKSDSKAAYKGLGSIDIFAAARSVLLVGENGDDNQQSVFVQTKCNIHKRGPAISYSVVDGYFNWLGESDIKAGDILKQQDSDSETASALTDAEDFIKQLLSSGPYPAKQAMEEALENGIAERTLKRAKRRLGIKSIKTDSGWVWQECQP